MTEETRPGGSYRVAWMVLFLIAVVLIALGLAMMFLPEGSGLPVPTEARDSQLLGIATAAIGVLSASVIWYGIRDGSPLSIRITWTLPVLAAGIAAVYLIGGEHLAAAVYAGTAAVSAWMLAHLARHLD